MPAQLRQWLERVGINSYQELARQAEVGLSVVGRLRKQEAHHIPPVKLARLANILKCSPLVLLQHFSPLNWGNPHLEQEFKRLQEQLAQQPELLTQDFHYQTYKQLEPLLVQYPTACYLAAQNPQWPARQLVPLFNGLNQLLQRWHITALGTVGSALPFDPQEHQSQEELIPGELVYIRFVGYCTPERLLKRASVSRTPPPGAVS